MLLTADIGNTSITLGVFDGNALVEEFRLASDRDLSVEEYEVLIRSLLKDFRINGCVISSVVEELTYKIKEVLNLLSDEEPLVLSSSLVTDFKICIDNKNELGADRIANAAAAFVLYKKPVIVIDFGTATSFDIVNGKGEFVGGVIAPGINIQLKSLNKFTSKLPKIEAASSPVAIGTNTVDAILSGVIRGCASMIDGLVEQCEKELGEKAVIVATGGYAQIISEYLKRPFDYINPILTLEGMRYLYYSNKKSIYCK